MDHATLTVREKKTGLEFKVNTTPNIVLEELEKPKHLRNHMILAQAHEPYYDPNIHDLVDEDDAAPAKADEKKTNRTRVKAADKTPATATPATPDPDDEDDDDEDDKN